MYAVHVLWASSCSKGHFIAHKLQHSVTEKHLSKQSQLIYWMATWYGLQIRTITIVYVIILTENVYVCFVSYGHSPATTTKKKLLQLGNNDNFKLVILDMYK